MSEEEKGSIIYLEFLSNEKCECEVCQNAKKRFKIILNLIEKQQEKIKELTAFYNDFESEKITNYPIFKQRYIAKDKIRAKIKEKQDKIDKLHPASDIVIIDDLENQINCYKELLEENNNG